MGGAACAEELEKRRKALKAQAKAIDALIASPQCAALDPLLVADACGTIDTHLGVTNSALAGLFASVRLPYPPA